MKTTTAVKRLLILATIAYLALPLGAQQPAVLIVPDGSMNGVSSLDTTLMPHPESPGAKANAAAAAALLKQQAQQLKLQNQQLQLQIDQQKRTLAAQQTVPQAPIVAAPAPATPLNELTGGMMNGRTWRVFSPMERSLYISGLRDAASLGELAARLKTLMPEYAISLQDLTNSVGRFYDDPVNVNVPVFAGLIIACMRLRGEDPATVENIAAGFRRIAIAPVTTEGTK